MIDFDGGVLTLTAARVAPAIGVALAASRVALPRLAAAAVVALVVLAVAALGAAALAPAAQTLATGPLSAQLAIVARELAIGLALGVTAAVPLVAGEMVGAWVSAALGEADAASPWATATGAVAALVFFALGGHRVVIVAILASYQRAPVLETIDWIDAGALLVGTALALALPMLGALVVAALTLGAVERASADGPVAPAAVWMRAAAVLALAAMVFALAYGVAGLTRALPAELAR